MEVEWITACDNSPELVHRDFSRVCFVLCDEYYYPVAAYYTKHSRWELYPTNRVIHVNFYIELKHY